MVEKIFPRLAAVTTAAEFVDGHRTNVRLRHSRLEPPQGSSGSRSRPSLKSALTNK